MSERADARGPGSRRLPTADGVCVYVLCGSSSLATGVSCVVTVGDPCVCCECGSVCFVSRLTAR